MSKHMSWVVLATAAVALALAGCTTKVAGEADAKAVHSSGLATPATPDSTTTEAAEPAKSPRGAIPKAVGEVAGLCTDEDCQEMAVTFTIDKIEVDPTCTEDYAEPPENGHNIALSMTIKTTDKFTQDMAYEVNFSPFAFEIVGPDGVTEPSNPGPGAYGCMAGSDFLPDAGLAPSSQYVGVIVLDSKHASGVLMLRMSTAGFGGWEWTY